MAIVQGDLILTQLGLNALMNAQVNGTSVELTEFAFTETAYVLDETLTTADVSWWTRNAITASSVIGNDTIRVSCQVEAADATNTTATIFIFTENNVLFAIAKPLYPMQRVQRQLFEAQIAMTNIGSVVDFTYVVNHNKADLNGDPLVIFKVADPVDDMDAVSKRSVPSIMDAHMNRTYYVDSVGGDDANAGTEALPFQTIDQCFVGLNRGAKVIIYLANNQFHDMNNRIDVSDYVVHIKRYILDAGFPDTPPQLYAQGDENSSGGFDATTGEMTLFFDGVRVNTSSFSSDHAIQVTGNPENQVFIQKSMGKQLLHFTNGHIELQEGAFMYGDGLFVDTFMDTVDVNRATSGVMLFTFGGATGATYRNITVTGNTTELVDLFLDTAPGDSIIGDTVFAGTL